MKKYHIITFLLLQSTWAQNVDLLTNYQKNLIHLKKDLNQEVLVAVIDTGIDINHPDLKANIAKNLKECDEQGNPPVGKIEDRDKNGFPGDCLGWNFIPNESAPETRPEDISDRETPQLPEDFEGHGTHVSGVIAAVTGNRIGLSNSTNKIKVLPLKVFQKTFQPQTQFRIKSDNKVSNVNRASILIQAIDYAIKRKVDIINFSIGWNKNIDNPLLRSKIQEAYNKGIIIVAAAGNDASEVTTFPCLYENVICVGSLSDKNQILESSNTGNAIDLYAPGEEVLSTFPTDAIFSNFMNGYAVYSGTSQAAPYVAKILAHLKGLDNSKNTQDYLRILLETSNTSAKNQNFLNAQNALEQLNAEVFSKDYVIPSFKSLLQLTLDENHEVSLKIPLKIFSQNLDLLKIELTPENKNLVVSNPQIEIKPSTNYVQEAVEFKIKVQNLSIAQKQNFSLTIKNDQKLHLHYAFATKFYRTDLKPQEILPFEYTTTQPYLTSRGQEKGTPLVQLKNLYGEATNQFYVTFFDKKETSTNLRLTLHQLQNNVFKEATSQTFTDVLLFYGLYPVDLNFDNNNEYLLVTETVEKKENADKVEENIRYVKVYYLDEFLKPIYQDAPFIRYDLVKPFPLFNPDKKVRVPLYPTGNLAVLPFKLNDRIYPQIITFHDHVFIENYRKLKNRILFEQAAFIGPDIFFFKPTLDKNTNTLAYQVSPLSKDLNSPLWEKLLPQQEYYKISSYSSVCKNCNQLEIAAIYSKGKMGKIRLLKGEAISQSPSDIPFIRDYTKKYDPKAKNLLGVRVNESNYIHIQNFTNNKNFSSKLTEKSNWRALYLAKDPTQEIYQVVLNNDSSLMKLNFIENQKPLIQSVKFDKYFGTSWSSTGDLFDVFPNLALLEGFKLSDLGVTLIPLNGDSLTLSIEHSLHRNSTCLPLGLIPSGNEDRVHYYQLCQENSNTYFVEKY
jgi:hypothetical protein